MDVQPCTRNNLVISAVTLLWKLVYKDTLYFYPFSDLRCGLCRLYSQTPSYQPSCLSVHVSSVWASKNFAMVWRRTNHTSISQGRVVIVGFDLGQRVILSSYVLITLYRRCLTRIMNKWKVNKMGFVVISSPYKYLRYVQTFQDDTINFLSNLNTSYKIQ